MRKCGVAPTSQFPNMPFHAEYARLLSKWASGIPKAYIDVCAASLMHAVSFQYQGCIVHIMQWIPMRLNLHNDPCIL